MHNNIIKLIKNALYNIYESFLDTVILFRPRNVIRSFKDGVTFINNDGDGEASDLTFWLSVTITILSFSLCNLFNSVLPIILLPVYTSALVIQSVYDRCNTHRTLFRK